VKPFVLNKYLLIAGLFFAVLFCMATSSNAQQNDTASKAGAPKTKRVLYGMASFYANKFNGRRTALGEIFSQNKFTCACNVLPLGTWIRVTNLHNGRTVIVKTNDRLHPKMKRIIDLSRAAATKLGYVGRGLTRVKVEVLGKTPPKTE
jgi:rare lipoprotein A